MIDHDEELHNARARIEELEAALQTQREAIADATEQLGHEGFGADDLRDAVGIVSRLLEGKDLDCGIEYVGIAAEVEKLVSKANERWLLAYSDDAAEWKTIVHLLLREGETWACAIESADNVVRAWHERRGRL